MKLTSSLILDKSDVQAWQQCKSLSFLPCETMMQQYLPPRHTWCLQEWSPWGVPEIEYQDWIYPEDTNPAQYANKQLHPLTPQRSVRDLLVLTIDIWVLCRVAPVYDFYQ